MNKVDPVQFISAQQTIDLRQRILRPGQDPKRCHYLEDDLQTTFHLGIIHEGVIICNGTFIKMSHPFFTDSKHPYRLRGMATEINFQRKGLGSVLLQKSLVILGQKNCDLLWFNARVSAINFYSKLGFETKGEVFDLPDIGPHIVMFKKLYN